MGGMANGGGAMLKGGGGAGGMQGMGEDEMGGMGGGGMGGGMSETHCGAGVAVEWEVPGQRGGRLD